MLWGASIRDNTVYQGANRVRKKDVCIHFPRLFSKKVNPMKPWEQKKVNPMKPWE